MGFYCEFTGGGSHAAFIAEIRAPILTSLHLSLSGENIDPEKYSTYIKYVERMCNEFNSFIMKGILGIYPAYIIFYSSRLYRLVALSWP